LSAQPAHLVEAREPVCEHTAEPPPRAALRNIQALRALAAFMVVCVHLQALALLAGAPANATDAGNAGVDLFFVISGFIMVFTTGRKPQGPLAFLGARVRRIVPLYWSVTLAVFLVALLAPRLTQNTEADLPHLIGSLLFLPVQREDGTLRPTVFVGWTLNFEMAFYALFALGLAAPRRWIGVGATVGVLLVAVVWGWLVRPSAPALGFYTTPMILEFGLGMLLGLAWPRLRLPEGPSWPPAALALAAFGLILAAPGLWPHADRLFAFGLPAAVMVAALLALERRGLSASWRWVQALGAASYAIYLSHFFVTQAAVMLARRVGLHGPWEAAAAAIAAFVGVALLGLALHHTVERGADNLIGRIRSLRVHTPRRAASGLVKVKSVAQTVD
jgi:peptidoglycan/LPS O-acetylase OafA/YrhL